MNKVEDNSTQNDVFKKRTNVDPFAPAEAAVHKYGAKQWVCSTDSKGYPTPRNKGITELIIDASEGFIPLWDRDVHLRWRFSPKLLNFFQDPEAAKKEIESLFAKAVIAWGDASPIKFSKNEKNWDFEIVVKPDNCSYNGCTLASAFFPDGGRHELALHPQMFKQSYQEQVETLIHEIGHIFGLRHFFASVSETAWPSVKFGTQNPFTIMNYGPESILTETDKSDLKELYQKVWSGELKEINGTKIVTFRPYHEAGNSPK
jgi:hypothetical protein